MKYPINARVGIFSSQSNSNMPSNGRISVSVQIGNNAVPEYYKDGIYYVECDLFTPYSYDQEVRELAYGEIEIQKWPVTPYTVEVYLQPREETSWVILTIDGVNIDFRILNGGQKRYVSLI